MNSIAILYSGGTDSTAATVLLAEKYDSIHLVTCHHSGMANITNSAFNVEKLRELYGDKFVHHIFDINELYKLITYERYLSNLWRYGFFTQQSCGLCKLAMHLRALLYCLDNEIAEVADGANVNMPHFPAQMREVVDAFVEMYRKFGITYTSPVFDHEFPDDIDWIHKVGLADLTGKKRKVADKAKGRTTGQIIHDAGITPEENVKGTPHDRKMQGLCFQLTLLNNFALGYYIPKHGMEKYRELTAQFYRDKIAHFLPMVETYQTNKSESRLFQVVS